VDGRLDARTTDGSKRHPRRQDAGRLPDASGSEGRLPRLPQTGAGREGAPSHGCTEDMRQIEDLGGG
jgi:hypothetical protein